MVHVTVGVCGKGWNQITAPPRVNEVLLVGVIRTVFSVVEVIVEVTVAVVVLVAVVKDVTRNVFSTVEVVVVESAV